VGLTGDAAQLFATVSLQLGAASMLALIEYVQLLLSTEPTIAAWAGAAVIVVSDLKIVQRKHRSRRQASEAIGWTLCSQARANEAARLDF
jgi:drug/metabolite transporter (DMT)-like permease